MSCTHCRRECRWEDLETGELNGAEPPRFPEGGSAGRGRRRSCRRCRTGARISCFPRDRRSRCSRRPATTRLDVDDLAGTGLSSVSVRGQPCSSSRTWSSTKRDTAINTHPLVVAGAATRSCARARARWSSVKDRGIDATSSTCSRRPVCDERLRDLRLRFVDLNHDDVRAVPLKKPVHGARSTGAAGGAAAGGLHRLDAEAEDAPLGGDDGEHEELFGRVPGAVYGWPKNLLHVRGIEQSILDLTATIRPHLSHRGCGGRHGGRRSDHGAAATARVSRNGHGPGGRGRDLRPDHRPRSAKDAVSRLWRHGFWETWTRLKLLSLARICVRYEPNST